jgi:hypothetical protein
MKRGSAIGLSFQLLRRHAQGDVVGALFRGATHIFRFRQTRLSRH